MCKAFHNISHSSLLYLSTSWLSSVLSSRLYLLYESCSLRLSSTLVALFIWVFLFSYTAHVFWLGSDLTSSADIPIPSTTPLGIIISAIGWPLETDYKKLLLKLLKTPPFLITRHGESKLNLSSRLPSWWPALTVLEEAVQVAVRELLCCLPCSLTRHDGPTPAIVASP